MWLCYCGYIKEKSPYLLKIYTEVFLCKIRSYLEFAFKYSSKIKKRMREVNETKMAECWYEGWWVLGFYYTVFSTVVYVLIFP